MTSSSAPPPRPELPARPRHVHLIAIAGVGMASLAGLFREAGYHVTGSDAGIYPPMSTLLASLRVPVAQGFSAANLEPRPDLVVIGNAMSRGNPEVEATLASGIPYCSMPEALMRFFMAGRRRAAIVGTHGKTTSSALLAWVLQHAGMDPGFMIGGACRDLPQNFRIGGGEWFVIEGDEYDTAFFDKGPKFLHYDPDAVLLTAVEYDHADIYRDLAHVKSAFVRLLQTLRPSTTIVASADYPEVAAVVAASGRRAAFFGVRGSGDWQAEAIRDDGDQTAFVVRAPDGTRLSASCRGPGAMNVANALGVLVVADGIGVPHDVAIAALASFHGVRRRQEVIGEGRGIVLIDDFAHHPTAVAATLAALRTRYGRRRIWTLFEPRSNTSRRRVFQDAYVDALAAANRVTLAGVHHKEQLPDAERLSTETLVQSLVARGVAAELCDDPADIAKLVERDAASGDVIVLMSNGAFGGLAQSLPRTLDLTAPG